MDLMATVDLAKGAHTMDHRTGRTRLALQRRAVAWLLVGAVVVAIVLAFLLHHWLMASTASPLQGTDLGGTPAPGFALVDQAGARVSLASLRGHPVALTFLYTHCPTLCPLTAEKLRMAANQLGPQANAARWVAISLDPVGDTPQSATAFVAAHGLQGKLQFLVGSASQLNPIWHAYFIGVQAELNAQSAAGPIMHGVGVFVIDGQGRERAFLNDAFTPSSLAFDLRALLGSPNR
jgi:protein SCO1/2